MGYNVRVVEWNNQAGIYMRKPVALREVGNKVPKTSPGLIYGGTVGIHRDSLNWGPAQLGRSLSLGPLPAVDLKEERRRMPPIYGGPYIAVFNRRR